MGDVVLAPVTLGKRHTKKARPVVIIADSGNNSWLACPISSTPAYDAPSISLDLKDFEDGGLDIMLESYVLAGTPVSIRASDIIGKKGRLSQEAIAAIISIVPGD